ncbi:endolytic transglycosylase MltG [Flavicella sediminum]|uniref:endolytic transglycosylase MltG n=1 Tax=Flavicella sediminum TaxID=2585141 RepID=UPI00112364AB|nr:endolytic transglycosylase MltG [Flavicella sediminum]
MLDKKKLITFIAIAGVILSVFVGYHYYSKIYAKNLTSDFIIYIPTNATLADVKEQLKDELLNLDDFEWVAQKKKYNTRIRAGKFQLKAGMNNNELVNFLRSGRQTTVNLTFNNQHSLEDLAGRIASQLEADSLSLLTAFKDESFLQKNGFTKATALSMYIPNSYDLYWNTDAEGFRAKMFKEYNTFWNANRISKAQQQKLTIEEVSILASIVQKETAITSERPIVAGLYLNRFHKKWPLQADPTVIFSIKEKYGQDTIIKRVLLKDLKIDSPYNTYKNVSLPPGPIAMPDISSIDAVLNPANHDYFYMCASIEKFGSHAFAKSLRQHNKNARKYQKWLSKQGVNR